MPAGTLAWPPTRSCASHDRRRVIAGLPCHIHLLLPVHPTEQCKDLLYHLLRVCTDQDHPICPHCQVRAATVCAFASDNHINAEFIAGLLVLPPYRTGVDQVWAVAGSQCEFIEDDEVEDVLEYLRVSVWGTPWQTWRPDGYTTSPADWAPGWDQRRDAPSADTPNNPTRVDWVPFTILCDDAPTGA